MIRSRLFILLNDSARKIDLKEEQNKGRRQAPLNVFRCLWIGGRGSGGTGIRGCCQRAARRDRDLGLVIDLSDFGGHRIGTVDRLHRLLSGDAIDRQPMILLEEARFLAKRLHGKPAIAMGLIIEAVEGGLSRSLVEGLELEAKLFGRTFLTEDSPHIGHINIKL